MCDIFPSSIVLLVVCRRNFYDTSSPGVGGNCYNLESEGFIQIPADKGGSPFILGGPIDASYYNKSLNIQVIKVCMQCSSIHSETSLEMNDLV